MTGYEIDYKECKENFKDQLDLDGSRVKIHTGTSTEDLKLAKKVIANDEVLKIIHYRNREKIEYYTIIYADDIGKIIIDGGLTSGYIGGGTSAFKMLLVHLGVDENEAENVVQKQNTAFDIAKIEVNFSRKN